MPSVASLLLGLACGSIPFGYLAGRIKGTDIRTRGSGNIGFTNVYRVLGIGWAIPVLVLDVAKGFLPTAFAHSLGLAPSLVGTGAVLGHVFTPWLRFQGGKGVATTIGVTFLLCFRSILAGLGLYAVVLLAAGYVSVSSLSLAVALPLLTALFYPRDPQLIIFTGIVGLVIIFRHTDNIRRLARGKEPKFGLWLKLFRKTQ